MPTILIVGATRGLGAALVSEYSSTSSNTVYGTARSSAPDPSSKNIHYLTSIDLSTPDAGAKIISQLPSGTTLNTVIITAGTFIKETLEKPDWDAEVLMYKTSALGPTFLVSALVAANVLVKGSKVILVSSESGSIALRHEEEGGGNYGHHASKTALNMVGKLLSLDLKDKGVAVGMVHPGFMRTEMTKGVGFDEFWDEGGAVTPEVAAKSLAQWVEGEFDIGKTGTYWAPRGPGDIGTAEVVLGKGLGTPLELPW